MQIHEFNNLGRDPVTTDYIAIDTGDETNKLSLFDYIYSKFMTLIDPKIILDVVVDSSTGRATSGEDKDLYNALVDLGWTSDVIVTE